MRDLKFLIGIFLILPFLNSCKKDFSVNADWKDITIVYGLLSWNDNVHYLKITKAFLGPGNALTYARIADSSNYRPGDLNVRIDVIDESGNFNTSIKFDTTVIVYKEPGNSIIYFPDSSLVYKSTANLEEKYTYKLIIHNNRTGEDITSQTIMVNNFSISKPDPFAPYPTADFKPGVNSSVEWTTAVGGRRYQLVIRFHYTEKHLTDPLQTKFVDWLVFSNEQSRIITKPEDAYNMVKTFSGSSFYSVLAANIKPVDPSYTRSAGNVDYIFSVASDDLNTYMEVTEPSSSIVQYRPPFTNITNGIGLFSSRLINSIPPRTLSDETKKELKKNPNTAGLGF